MGKAREIKSPAAGSTVHAEPWSAWQPLTGIGPLPRPVLAEILDGGQAFRWNRAVVDRVWEGIFGEYIVRVRPAEDGTVEWSAPRARQRATESALLYYFDAARDATGLADALPWRTDAHLALCREKFPGLRILRQPFGDTLLGFLCSATKQIVQIKQMLALLAERHGAMLTSTETSRAEGRGQESAGAASAVPRRLPTWPELALIPEAELRACLLGFRAKYIHETAQFLAAHPGWLEATELLPYAEAKARLSLLPGVGEKIADCVLLFGAGRLEAFPVDVWILKTMELRYGLAGWKPAQVAQFGRIHFGPLAGLAQQFLFAYERQAAREKRA